MKRNRLIACALVLSLCILSTPAAGERFAIADIDMQRLDWKRALAAYNELSTSDPDDEAIALTLVDLYYKVNQANSALRQLDRYLVRLVRQGQGEKVESILEDMIERRPDDAGLADRLTRLYIRQGREQEAINLLDKLGEAQLDAGETQKAIETINRILQLNPPNATSYRQLLHRLRQSAGCASRDCHESAWLSAIACSRFGRPELRWSSEAGE